MKILVFSDSHGVTFSMEDAAARENPDLIVHLGDYVRDGERLQARLPGIPILQVAGNCDRIYDFSGCPEILTTTCKGVKLYLTHGHRQGVKMGLLKLKLAAQEAGARIALFGHTHFAYCEEQDGVILMNPGTCGGGRGTYGVISIQGGKPTCEIRSIPG